MSTTPVSLPEVSSISTFRANHITVHFPTPYPKILNCFRALVPALQPPGILRTQPNAEAIINLIKSTNTPSDFVCFAEFDHGSWLHHFLPPSKGSESESGTGRRVHRFLFGNPLLAAAMIKESRYAGTHVPLDCGFVEEEDGSATMVMVLPLAGLAGIYAGEESGRVGVERKERLDRAVGEVEGKVWGLISMLQEENK
ncbi:uncharacterized protein BO88DRAFT_445311 [Aspergillus vadensis CBS 113365]|uniref:DUF302 domain-containing protein n=1 Tax=Aspergillus vadensis (strain CBS 113365 / IMI 142717 / IBT 24658) TaxID=1448311 RepID=A0A319B3M2_ASPVC|nr:hypothetical protein BO88DRAFT_445311 [Aspergillus vadensis CBS 113365]PYH66905.1 hypothetical protein BO88DRAFT_445311 [Aspergillus vadensis CBS 113365]